MDYHIKPDSVTLFNLTDWLFNPEIRHTGMSLVLILRINILYDQQLNSEFILFL